MKKVIKIPLIVLAVPAFLFIIFYLLTMGVSVAKTVEQDPSLPHITIDGVTFHAEAFGNPENPIVIVVHGGPGNDYRSLLSLQALSDEYYVVFYDQRGTGLSPRVSAEELTFDSTVSDLNLIVDYFGGGGKVNLIAHSFGAMFASPYLGKYPEKVDHIVLSEPGFLSTEMAMKYMGYFASIMDKPNLVFRLNGVKTWFENFHITGPDEQAKADNAFHNSGLYIDGKPGQVEYYCNGEYAAGKSIYWRSSALASQSIQDLSQVSEWIGFDSEGNLQFNLTKGVENFTNKVLFIASECNTVIGVEVQSIHMTYFPNAELAVIEGAGHDMYSGKPEETIAVIREYLNTSP
jgi:proline iminopeptidase